MAKGEDVISEPFGGEGTGAHAFINYNWKVDTTYRLLLKGRPDSKNRTFTTFTAWFAEEQGDWKLLASFKRPKTKGDYLWGWGSFLENFNSDNGYEERKGYLGNQWYKEPNGDWREVTKTKYVIGGGVADEPRIE